MHYSLLLYLANPLALPEAALKTLLSFVNLFSDDLPKFYYTTKILVDHGVTLSLKKRLSVSVSKLVCTTNNKVDHGVTYVNQEVCIIICE